MSTDPVVIVGLARTPMGAFQGELPHPRLRAWPRSALGVRAHVN